MDQSAYLDHVLVPGPDGQPVEWGFETGSPNMLRGRGWKPKTIKPGDKVTATMHPKRDGSKVGSLVQMTLPDGTVMKDRDLVLGGVPDAITAAPPPSSAPANLVKP